MGKISRRELFLRSGVILGAGAAAPRTTQEPKAAFRGLKVVVAGGHPDDPETGCGGLLARYADLGAETVSLYLTKGEAGIRGKSHEEAAAIRSAECRKACEILKARPRFVGQIDGSTEINKARYEEVRKILEEEKPSVVFTHWPIDTHRDHRAISLLVYDAWLRMSRRFALYYFEVMTGSQTQHFHPTDYVDITPAEARKREACFAHASQNPEGLYARHSEMHRLRGMERRVKHAEAFVRHLQSRVAPLP